MRRLFERLTATGAVAIVLTTAIASAQSITVVFAADAQVAKPAAKPAVVVEKFVKKAVPAKGAVVAEQAVAVGRMQLFNAGLQAGQDDAMAAQLSQQIRPVLRAELHLIRNVCKTSKDEQLKIAAAGEKGLNQLIDSYVEWQKNAQQGRAGQMVTVNAEAIQRFLLTAIRANLSPEKARLYESEVNLRISADRQASARSLVARLDRALNLSADQKIRIVDALVKSNDQMIENLDMHMYNNEGYFPNIMDRSFLEVLDERQKSIWNSTAKINYGTSNFGVQGINFNANDFAEEDHPDAQAERAKANANRAIKEMFRRLTGLDKAAPQPGGGMVLQGAVQALPVAPAAPAVMIRARPAAKAAPVQVK